MWGSIFSTIGKVARAVSPLIQAGATIYAASQQRKGAEAQATALRESNQKARKQQRTLMASTKAAAQEKKQALAKQTAALQSLLKEREEKTKKIATTQEREKKRQRRSLIHTTQDVWQGAAPLIKKSASSPQLKAALGG